MKKILALFLSLFVNVSTFAFPLNKLHLPKGFSIDIYAQVPNARSMALGTEGTVFLGSREAGKVYALIPNKEKTKATQIVTIAENLNQPNGVAFHDGSLYVAEIHRVLRFDNIEQHLTQPPVPVVIYDKLPTEKHHGWRYMRFGPDGKIYIAIGAPCNVCLSSDPRFASIVRMNKDGSNLEIFAIGIRNSVGFDWDANKILWFTDNGRDLMGDNVPPDELNSAPRAGMHFGFPFLHGKNILDPEYHSNNLARFTQPALELPPHAASLGMLYYRGHMFPPEYQNQIYIALHGSWDRSTKIGYEVIMVKLSKNKLTFEPFITGWLEGDTVLGRPVDIIMLQDGSILISDDYAGFIYRVVYNSVIPATSGGASAGMTISTN